METFSGRLVDVVGGRIFRGILEIEGGRIAAIREDEGAEGDGIFLPGLVDAHVHIESSLLAPTEFARAATIHGTVATVSDPHEIANVCGIEGVRWMIENGERTPLKIFFGAPSCVPATPFETAGAAFDAEIIDGLLADERILYLSEVMNFPAVIHGDPAMSAILDCAKRRGKRIDGHAPGVVGDDLRRYAAAGIETEHECVTLDEGRQRIAAGMKVAIREGSAARNFDALWPLLRESPEACFFCSDDKHPDELIISHINALIARAVARGIEPMVAIRAATLNPVRHYGLPVGLLRVGDPADFIEVADLERFEVRRTWIDGRRVAADGRPELPRVAVEPINRFAAKPVDPRALSLPHPEDEPFPVIVAEDGQLVTGREDLVPTLENGEVVSDPDRDLLKIVVYNRYREAAPVVGLVRHFGLKSGAMAGSVAHDSHNIVAVGASDEMIARAINAVVEAGGGLAFAGPEVGRTHPLPVAGLMGTGEAWEAAAAFTALTELARADGCGQRSPYMTLSFMALLVIPKLKIGDRGLFDVDAFALL
jgi:adenine deaminase